jgi:alpha-L-arabinofuranosidase
MVLTPTYHVYRMFRVHQGATLIPIELNAPQYRMGEASVPSLSVSASRDDLESIAEVGTIDEYFIGGPSFVWPFPEDRKSEFLRE